MPPGTDVAPAGPLGGVADIVRIVGEITLMCGSDLPEVVQALHTASALPRFVERGQQHGCQNRDDCDNDKKFNQGKTAFLPGGEARQRHDRERSDAHAVARLFFACFLFAGKRKQGDDHDGDKKFNQGEAFWHDGNSFRFTWICVR